MNQSQPEKQTWTVIDALQTSGLSEILLEAIPIGICAVDLGGRIVSLNTEGARLLGWSEASCRGHLLHELIRCNTLLENNQTTCPVAQVLWSGEPYWAPHINIACRNGRMTPVEYKCVPLRSSVLVGALFSFRDLTHQLQLQQDRSRLVTIPEDSPFPIVELDANASLIYANPQMVCLLQQFGYSDAGFLHVLPPHLPPSSQKFET